MQQVNSDSLSCRGAHALAYILRHMCINSAAENRLREAGGLKAVYSEPGRRWDSPQKLAVSARDASG